MPANVQCPTCQKQFAIKDEFVGRVGRCTGCKATFTMTPVNIVAAKAVASVAASRVAVSGAPAVAAAGNGKPAGAAAMMIGRFQIRKKLGAGAFGTVYRAFDPQLEREVALKVPLPGMLNTPQRVERFLREAKASAQLTHPHIVPVYDAGKDDGRYYIAAAFIEGKPLADAIDETGVDPQRAARIVADLGDALFYAHMLGIVHRDIKPANIMLDGDDRPHLMDFGLAAWENSTEKLTHDGAVLGTPSYMSPEQAEGKQGEAKAESDQYSLGVVLYELLTGTTPFEGPPQIVIHNVINKEPPRPTALRKDIPRDLETICLKAMAKRPQDRYSSCQALARDLRRWLDDEPIQARRLGLVERVGRWARREPKLAAAAGVIMLLLATVGGLLAWKVGELTANVLAEQNQKAAAFAARDREAANLEAEKNEHDLTRKDGYFGQIGLVDAHLDGGDQMAAYRLLPDIKPEFRGWEWNHLLLAGEGAPAAARIFGNRNTTVAVAFNAASSQLICANYGGLVQVFDVATGREIRSFELPGGFNEWQNARFALSGDGERLISVRIAGLNQQGGPIMMPSPVAPQPVQPKAAKIPDEAVVWDVRTGKRLVTLKADLKPGPMIVAVNDDGSRIALNNGSKIELALYDGKTGNRLHALDGCGMIQSLVFDPSGATLFAVDGGETTVHEPRTGTRTIWKDVLYTEEVIDKDGAKKLITQCRKVPETVSYTYNVERTIHTPQSIKTWDVESGSPKTPLVSRPSTKDIVLTRDGKLGVLLGTYYQTVSRAVEKCIPVTLQVEKEKIGKDGNKVKYLVQMYEMQTATETVVQRIAVGDGSLPIDDVATGQETGTWADAAGAQAVAFSPDGSRVATTSMDACRSKCVVKLWDAKTKSLVLTLRLPYGAFLYVTHLAWSPDGQHLAGWGLDGRVVVWSAMTGRSIYHRNDFGGPVNAVAWSPDGKQLAAVSDCTSKGSVLDPAAGKELFAFSSVGISARAGTGGGCIGLAFTGNGQRLVRSGMGRMGEVSWELSPAALQWESATGNAVKATSATSNQLAMVLAVSGDGTRVIAQDGGLVVRAAPSGKELCKLETVYGPVDRVVFSPDAKFVAVATSQWDNGQKRGDVHVLSAVTGKRVLLHENASGAFAFRPDSGRFVSASALIVPQQMPGVPAQVRPQPAPPQPAPKPIPAKESPIAFQDEAPPPPQKAPIVVPQPAPMQTPAPQLPPTVFPQVKVFNLTSGQPVQTIDGFFSNVSQIEYSPSGKQLAIVSRGLRVVDAETGKTIMSANDAAGPFAFAADRIVYIARQQLAAPPAVMPAAPPQAAPAPAAPAAANEKAVNLEFEPIAVQVVSVPANDDDMPAAPVCFPGMPVPPVFSLVKIWDFGTKKEIAVHSMLGNATALTVSRLGDLCAVASLPQTPPPQMSCGLPAAQSPDLPPVIHVLSPASGKALTTFHGHADRVNCLAFSPEGERLASAGNDGVVRVWSLQSIADQRK